MKKVFLTAAAACALFANASAEGVQSKTINGGFNVHVVDNIMMEPATDFGIGPFDFTTPEAMAAGADLPAVPYEIDATRSWTVTYKATDFTRSEAAQANVAQTIPVGELLKIKADNPGGGTTYVVGGLHPASVGGYVIASGPGGSNRTFDLSGKITPTFAYNMSGHYTTTVQVIAALD